MKKIKLILAFFVLASCSKTQIEQESVNEIHKYQLWIDHYSKDLSKLGLRTLVWQDYITSSQAKCDTIKNKVFLNCATDSIEHWYYKRDNDMIFENTMPILKPTKVDTTWVNYH